MKNKKIKTHVAKMFRELAPVDFIASIKIAKAFLNSTEWEPTFDNIQMGFNFEWDYDDTMVEYERYTGDLWIKDHLYPIPFKFYEMREKYDRNRSIH